MWQYSVRDTGEIGRDLGHGPAPEVPGVGEHVALVHQGQPTARPLGSALQGVPGHPADAERGVDALLGGHLGRRALAHDAAGLDVGALGALPDDQHVDRLVPDVGQRRGDARIQPDRPEVDVLVELEPQAQQQAALQQPARHAGIAHRAEQDGVVRGELAEHGVGQHLARPVDTAPSPGRSSSARWRASRPLAAP